MNYLILLPEGIVVFWLLLNTIIQIKERYKEKEIEIENERIKEESENLGKLVILEIILSIFLFHYYLDLESKEIELLSGNIKIGEGEVKIRIILTLLFGLGLFFYYNEKKVEKTLEYLQVLLLLYLSTLLLVIVSNLFVIYLLIELQSIIFYFLISWTKEGKSIRVGIEFFFQSIIFSLLILLSLFFIYFSTESFDLSFIIDLKIFLLTNEEVFTNEKQSMRLGIILLLFSFFFKMGLFPFHLWLLKVLRENNKLVIYFIGVFSKLAILYLLYRWLEFFFEEKKLILTIGLLAVIIGSLGGIIQTRVTNIFFFSSLTHLGLLLIILTMSNELSGAIYFYYLFFYMVLSFSFVFYLLEFENCKRIEDLGYLYEDNKETTFSFILLLFSYIGLPPLIGFYLKIGAVLSVVSKMEMINGIWMIGLILLLSLFGLIMYLKVSKNLLFGGYKDKEFYWYKTRIREKKEIEEKKRRTVNLLTLIINTGMILWYEELYGIIVEWL